jgi:hypothetical protein
MAIAILILVGPGARSILRQEEKPNMFGWDLTYAAILKKNNVGPDEFLAQWLKGTDRSVPRKFMERWKGERIVASIMIEHPAFHAGEHSLIWLFRTEKKAYIWTSHMKRDWDPEGKEIELKIFEDAFKAISAWEQAKPSPSNSANEGQRKALSGYFGFLNQFDSKGSRQILLVPADFFSDMNGRLVKTLEPCLK